MIAEWQWNNPECVWVQSNIAQFLYCCLFLAYKTFYEINCNHLQISYILPPWDTSDPSSHYKFIRLVDDGISDVQNKVSMT